MGWTHSNSLPGERCVISLLGTGLRRGPVPSEVCRSLPHPADGPRSASVRERPGRFSPGLDHLETIVSSIRRFLARPSSVSFEAIGRSGPAPSAMTRSAGTPALIRLSLTAVAQIQRNLLVLCRVADVIRMAHDLQLGGAEGLHDRGQAGDGGRRIGSELGRGPLEVKVIGDQTLRFSRAGAVGKGLDQGLEVRFLGDVELDVARQGERDLLAYCLNQGLAVFRQATFRCP